MADKDFIVKNGLVVGDAAIINGVQIDPFGATPNQVLKFDGTKFVPAEDSVGLSYYQTIGNGADSSFTLTHNFNTRDIVVTARNASSPYEVIDVRWEAATVDTIIVDFSAPPSSNSVRIGIYGSIGGAVSASSVSLIDDLNDVTITSVANGDFLRWNGSAWINDAVNLSTDTIGSYVESLVAGTGISISNNSGEGATPTISFSASLDNVSDVVITSPEEFQTLEYDGTNWVNAHASVVSYVRNAEANTITAGTCVYLFGSTGDHATVKRADNSSDTTSSKTVGVVGVNIASSENGPVITRGYVDGIDLSVGYTAGDVLWLGENGAFTVTKPTAPDHLVFIGVVVRATINGIIYVATQNGYELDELHDVSIIDKSPGNFLKYNGSLWVNDNIDLGTDTVGDYVSSLVAGTGITLSNNSGEGATPTITVNTTVIAALDSPTFTGTPLAPTAANTTNNTQIATTAYVKTVIGDLINSAPATLDTLGEIATSLANNESLSSTLTTSIALKAPLADPTFTGTVTLPDNTVALGTKTTGDYVASLVAGTGITLSNNSGEGATPTIEVNTSVIQARVADVSDTEIGYLNGVTSSIQTQLDNKVNSNTSPVITLDGDLTGSVTLANLSNATLTATIASNSVALGTDTTGNYMSNVSSGTGISVSHTPGEGSTATISLNATLDNLSDVNVATPTGGYVLTYDDIGLDWIAAAVQPPAKLDDIGDVKAASPSGGDLLKYDGGTSEWKNGTLALDDLSDVSASSPAVGQVLQWNGSSWVSANTASGGGGLNTATDGAIITMAIGA